LKNTNRVLSLNLKVCEQLRSIEKECFEAVFNRNGRVTECAHSNVHIIKDGTSVGGKDEKTLALLQNAMLSEFTKETDI